MRISYVFNLHNSGLFLHKPNAIENVNNIRLIIIYVRVNHHKSCDLIIVMLSYDLKIHDVIDLKI